MRPLKGVVIETGEVLVIRLTSRALVRVPSQKDLRLGDTCYVLYNYTTMEVREVWTEEEYNAPEDAHGDDPVFLIELGKEGPHEWACE